MSRLILTCAIVAFTFFGFFQNCSTEFHYPTNSTTQNSGGNGDAYEGKVYTHFGTCGTVEHAPDSKVVVSTNRLKIYSIYNNCAPVMPPVEVDPENTKELNDNSVVIKDRAFFVQGLVPSVVTDFVDQIGLTAGQPANSQARLTGFSGRIAVEAQGFDSQVSADGLTWGPTAQVLANQDFFIRASAPAAANDTRIIFANAGPLNINWFVSTVASVRSFTAPGTYAYNLPPFGNSFKVDCWGGGGGAGTGGGGGTTGGGGGGGGFSSVTLQRAQLQNAETLVVGQGGAGANNPNASGLTNGNAGTLSRFGTLVTAGAGGAGLSSSNGSTGGAGGAGSSANGAAGQPIQGGAGAGPGGGAGGANGSAGQAPGGGGGGTQGSGGGGVIGNGGGTGGNGGNGRCDVTILN